MKQFKDLSTEAIEDGFTGDKISIDRILNRKITVHKFRISPSRFPESRGNGKCLCLQIGIEENKHVVFTGSVILQKLINQLKEEDFPFSTIIVKQDKRLEFT